MRPEMLLRTQPPTEVVAEWPDDGVWVLVALVVLIYLAVGVKSARMVILPDEEEPDVLDGVFAALVTVGWPLFGIAYGIGWLSRRLLLSR